MTLNRLGSGDLTVAQAADQLGCRCARHGGFAGWRGRPAPPAPSCPALAATGAAAAVGDAAPTGRQPARLRPGRGPRLTLLAAIDDATGEVVGALWREQEDSHGSPALREWVVTAVGRPEAADHDRSGIFVSHARERERLAEHRRGRGRPSRSSAR